jgi:hypothetical protein
MPISELFAEGGRLSCDPQEDRPTHYLVAEVAFSVIVIGVAAGRTGKIP